MSTGPTVSPDPDVAGWSDASGRWVISELDGRLVLDSHLAWTPEFELRLDGSRGGRGSAPRGETLSIFERVGSRSLDDMVDEARATLVGNPFDQESFDAALEPLVPSWGAQATLALSIAFYLASRPQHAAARRRFPRLLLNVLNGGMHAYTNPVMSELHEIMIYALSEDLRQTADAYRVVLDAIKVELAHHPRVAVGTNEVHRVGDPPDEGALDLMRRVLDREGLERHFGIAVDASAGDWWTGEEYRLPVTNRRMTSDDLVEWWLGLIDAYGIAFLEDPLAEEDRFGWARLHAVRPESCAIVGDNYTSTSLDQLVGAGKAAEVDAAIVKPNQNGTVSGSLAFAAAARDAGLSVIASHRSVETESPFLVHLALDMGADGIKIGPFRDFTAVVKFNEFLRAEEVDR